MAIPKLDLGMSFISRFADRPQKILEGMFSAILKFMNEGGWLQDAS
jgi:hypothetical protein